MSESLELEQLTKSLSQIVHTLSDLITKNKSNPSLIQQNSRIKKTPEMTYHDYLVKVVLSKPPIEITGKRQSYHLQQDLELLLELSAYQNITTKCYEEVVAKKRIHRTIDSLKSRYLDYLSKIGEAEMKKIIAWVEREGVEGYLYFEDKELKISFNDPRDEKKEEKKEEKKDDKKRNRPASLDAGQKKFEKKSKDSKKGIPTNCKQLNDILKLYSKMVNVPIKTLLERLDQVSGDFVQLDNFIELKDSKILWSAEEDDILRKGGVEVDLLRKYRGAAVDARKKYLGIS